MKKPFMLLLLTSVVCAVFARGTGETSAPSALPTFTILNGAEPPTLDPSLSEDTASHNVLLALFDGLLVYDPKTNDGVPGVAESWRISDDATTWTFKLRKSTWSDGTPITARTVVDSWLYTLNPDTASPYAWLMGMVVKGANEYNSGEAGPEAVQIRALDDSTFQMDMVGPLPYVSSVLPYSIFAILPVHVIKEKGSSWTLPENMVSNGAFTLAEWVPQDHITVVKNPNYWDAANVKLGKIVYIPSDDNNTRYNMYINDEADWMNGGIPLEQLDAAKQLPDYQVSPALATYFYEFNHTMAPTNNVNVRKALSYALDRQTLVGKVTRAGQIPTTTIVPEMSGYAPQAGNEFNVKKAKQALADAGYPGGRGFPVLTILYNTSEGHKAIAEYVQQQWEQNLGIKVNIENAEWKTVLARGAKQDFQILRMGWIGDYQDPNTFLELFLTDGGPNFGKYSNPEFDKLILQAARMKPGPERFNVLKQAETMLMVQDQAIVSFYNYVNLHLIDTSKWGGWYPTTADWHPPKFIYLR